MNVRPSADDRESTSTDASGETPSGILPFGGQHTLSIRSDADAGELRLAAEDGRELVRIEVGARGLSLRASGLFLTWNEEGGLRLEVDRLTLVGREQVAIETAGDLALRAGGRMTFTASDQTITATVGDVQIHANDDVALSGEKILLNR